MWPIRSLPSEPQQACFWLWVPPPTHPCFPTGHFTQQRTKETNCDSDRERKNKQAWSPHPSQSTSSSSTSTDFGALLVKLDDTNVSRKGKNSVKSVSISVGNEGETSLYSLEASPLRQLMSMLSHPVIPRSSLLTKKLLRLLSLISILLPENKAPETLAKPGSSTGTPSTTSVTSTTAGAATSGPLTPSPTPAGASAAAPVAAAPTAMPTAVVASQL